MSAILAWLKTAANNFLGIDTSPKAMSSDALPDEPILKPLQLDPNTILSQTQCPLFSVIPPEIRNRIFEHVLAPYPDPDTRYNVATPYARPSHAARALQSTTLLQTCRLIYAEAWFHPWALSTHTFYLGHQARRPTHPTSHPITLQPALETLHAMHPEGPVELSNIQIFAQLFALEAGDIRDILRMEYFHPRTITLTLRHTDWWFWEDDVPLRIDGQWVRLSDSLWPSSVREVHLELESLERRRDQINDVALQIAEEWVFRRRDGAVLAIEGYAKQRGDDGNWNYPSPEDRQEGGDESNPQKPTPGTASHWTGSSTLNGARWLRDEPPGAPGTLNYYIRTLTFRPLAQNPPSPDATTTEGDSYPLHRANIETRIGAPLHSDPTTAVPAYEEAWELERAGCDDSMEAAEVRARLDAWRRARFEDARAAAEEEHYRNLRNELRGGQSVLDWETVPRVAPVVDGGDGEEQDQDGDDNDNDDDDDDGPPRPAPLPLPVPIGGWGMMRGRGGPRRPGRGRPGRGRLAGGPPL